MEANELRLGNYVNKFGIDYIMDMPVVDRDDVEVVSVNLEVLSDVLNFNNTDDYYYYQPIKLTEEWLLKLGFKKSYPAGWYDKNGIEIFNSNMKTGAYDYYFSSKTLTVMYVHELQNLYSLTGEELTIN